MDSCPLHLTSDHYAACFREFVFRVSHSIRLSIWIRPALRPQCPWYTSRQPPDGKATPIITPINAPIPVPASFPNGVFPSMHFPVHLASATAPSAKPGRPDPKADQRVPQPVSLLLHRYLRFVTRASRCSPLAVVMNRASSSMASIWPRCRLLSVVLASISVPTEIPGACPDAARFPDYATAQLPNRAEAQQTSASRATAAILCFMEGPPGLPPIGSVCAKAFTARLRRDCLRVSVNKRYARLRSMFPMPAGRQATR